MYLPSILLYITEVVRQAQKFHGKIKRKNMLASNPLNQKYALLSDVVAKGKLNAEELKLVEKQLEAAIDYLHQCDTVCGPLKEEEIILQKVWHQ